VNLIKGLIDEMRGVRMGGGNRIEEEDGKVTTMMRKKLRACEGG
jgi:hypothetical protein